MHKYDLSQLCHVILTESTDELTMLIYLLLISKQFDWSVFH